MNEGGEEEKGFVTRGGEDVGGNSQNKIKIECAKVSVASWNQVTRS